MSLIQYTGNPQLAIRPSRRKLTGTAHNVPGWTATARLLRAACIVALGHAPRRNVSADQVGCDVIDNLHRLDNRGLYVLQVVVSLLVRAQEQESRR